MIFSRRNVKNQCRQKLMKESDFTKIEQELQLGLNQVLENQSKALNNQGWVNTCLG